MQLVQFKEPFNELYIKSTTACYSSLIPSVYLSSKLLPFSQKIFPVPPVMVTYRWQLSASLIPICLMKEFDSTEPGTLLLPSGCIMFTSQLNISPFWGKWHCKFSGIPMDTPSFCKLQAHLWWSRLDFKDLRFMSMASNTLNCHLFPTTWIRWAVQKLLCELRIALMPIPVWNLLSRGK